jgi:hypothetical protein
LVFPARSDFRDIIIVMQSDKSVAAAVCALAIAAAALAVSMPAAAATMARIKVVGVDRNGHVIRAQPATLEAASGASYQVDGNAIRIPTGTYLIGGAVTTGSTSETLVVRQVRIARSETIRLSAVGGKLVRMSLTGLRVPPGEEQVNACLGTQTAAETPVSASGGGDAAVYAVPFRSRDVGFSYLASWPGYAITGSSADGVPSHLSYQQRPGGLAKLTLNVRSGVNPATFNLWDIGPGNYYQVLCSPGQVSGQMTAPFSVTQYVTPGVWTSNTDTLYVNSSGEADFTGFTYLVRRLAAGHHYIQNFGAAVAGPAPIQPSITGNIFQFTAYDLFDIPGFQGGDQCCARSTATLSRGSRKLWTEHLNEWRGNIYVSRTVTRAGWYNFDVSASRLNPHGSEPADLLSPRATIDWHFYIRPVPPAGNNVNFPVTVTTYEPRGLSMSNQALPDATTTVPFQIVRNGQNGNPTRQYPFRTVRVLVSFNDGASWHQVAVSRHGGNWLAVVHDPGSGFVALRSIVTDSHGDSTTQTIYRAYAIAG